MMKIFIFETLNNCGSGAYHPEGGLVVIARDRDHVLEVISVNKEIKIEDEEWETVESYDLAGWSVEPKYWIMPDAGCC